LKTILLTAKILPLTRCLRTFNRFALVSGGDACYNAVVLISLKGMVI